MPNLSFVAKATVVASFFIASAACAEIFEFTFHNLDHYSIDADEQIHHYGLTSLAGYFDAEDLNHDSRIDTSEVQAIVIGNYSFEEIVFFSYGQGGMLVDARGIKTHLTNEGASYSTEGYIERYVAGATSYIAVGSAVPEPAPFLLMLVGALGLSGVTAAHRRGTQGAADGPAR